MKQEVKQKILNNYLSASEMESNNSKVWHYLAHYYFEQTKRNTKEIDDETRDLLKNAIKCFIKSIINSSDEDSIFKIQNILHILNILFYYGENNDINRELSELLPQIHVNVWLKVL